MLLWLHLDQDPVSQLLGSPPEEQINGEASHAVTWQLLYSNTNTPPSPFALASKGSPISEIGSTLRSRVFVEIRPTNNEIRGFLHIHSHSNRSVGTNERAPLCHGDGSVACTTTGWLHSHRQMPLHQVSRNKNQLSSGSLTATCFLCLIEWPIPVIEPQLCPCTNESGRRQRSPDAESLKASSRCQTPARTADMHRSMRQWLPCRACLTRTRLERLRDSPSNDVSPNKEIIAPLRLGCEC